MKRKLDRSQPFATIASMQPQKAVYSQEGLYFDTYGIECGKVPGYVERKKEEAAKEESRKQAKTNKK